MSKNLSQNKKIILFDGICNLCNTSVQYIIKRDGKKIYSFASLQSDITKKILSQFNQKSFNNYDSIILIENEKVYYKSTAALRIAKNLSGLNKILYIFIIIPKPFRDFIYDFIAKNRYKWFGKKDNCMLPTPNMKSRFIEF